LFKTGYLVFYVCKNYQMCIIFVLSYVERCTVIVEQSVLLPVSVIIIDSSFTFTVLSFVCTLNLHHFDLAYILSLSR